MLNGFGSVSAISAGDAIAAGSDGVALGVGKELGSCGFVTGF